MEYNTQKYINLIRSRLSEKRFIHSVNVADSALELAKRYDADEYKAYLSGILHDIMKEEKIDIQIKFIEKNGEKVEPHMNRQIYHQMSAAAYCRLELGITDAEILGAIRYHTTGRRDMTLLEKIIYTADFISADRKYPDVEIMREKARSSLEDAMLYSLRYTITDLTKKALPIHPDTIECYNWILEGLKHYELS